MRSTRAARSRLSAARRSESSCFARRRDLGLEAALLELQEVELHRLGRGGLVVGEHDQLGDQRRPARRRRVGGWRRGPRGARAARRAARAPIGERCSSVSRSRYPRPPSAARCTSPAGHARGARARSARRGRRARPRAGSSPLPRADAAARPPLSRPRRRPADPSPSPAPGRAARPPVAPGRRGSVVSPMPPAPAQPR